MRKEVIIILVFAVLSGSVFAQKGAKSIAVGPLISFPLREYNSPSIYKIGAGFDAVGQYNFSNRSAILIQTGLTFCGIKKKYIDFYGNDGLALLPIRGGYRYQFGPSRFFIDGLIGTDIDLAYEFSTISFSIGAGKRFIFKDIYFFDVGLDYIDGDTPVRVNIKALFSIWRRPKEN